MSKVLFTCALVVNLLIVSCAAATVTSSTRNTNNDSASTLEKILERRHNLIITISQLIDDLKSLVTAMLTGNCNKPEHMIMANLVNILKKLLTLLNDNEQEKIHMIPGPHTTTIPITDADSEMEDK